MRIDIAKYGQKVAELRPLVKAVGEEAEILKEKEQVCALIYG